MRKKKVWTKQQDDILHRLVEQIGFAKWKKISDRMIASFHIKDINSKKCRQRYLNHVDQKNDNSQWTLQESRLLFDLWTIYGNQWTKIGSAIAETLKKKGLRSCSNTKNHFNSRINRTFRYLRKNYRKSGKQDQDFQQLPIYQLSLLMEKQVKKLNRSQYLFKIQAVELIKTIFFFSPLHQLTIQGDSVKSLQIIKSIRQFMELYNQRKYQYISESRRKKKQTLQLEPLQPALTQQKMQSYANHSSLFFEPEIVSQSTHQRRKNYKFPSKKLHTFPSNLEAQLDSLFIIPSDMLPICAIENEIEEPLLLKKESSSLTSFNSSLSYVNLLKLNDSNDSSFPKYRKYSDDDSFYDSNDSNKIYIPEKLQLHRLMGEASRGPSSFISTLDHYNI